MDHISAVNLAIDAIEYEDQILEEINRVLRSGMFILGRKVEEFERNFAAYHGIGHAVGVGSGTDALVLALKALGVGSGDEVVTVPNSFIATAAAIDHVGAKIVLVDVDEHQNMNPESLETAVNDKTRAVIPVHLNGKPASMQKIMQIAKMRDIPLIEDCSQAVGATYQGQMVGTFGKISAFSLHPLKNLGAFGDGGVIITDDKSIAQEIKLLRNHGLIDRDTCAMWGYNSRLDALQAAVLDIKLKHIDQLIKRKRQLATLYSEELKNVPVRLPQEEEWEKNVWYTYVIQTDHREELRQFLKENGVTALVHYPVPIHLQPAAQNLGYKNGSFPNCETQAQRILSLPIRPDMEEKHIRYIAGLIRQFFENNPGKTNNRTKKP